MSDMEWESRGHHNGRDDELDRTTPERAARIRAAALAAGLRYCYTCRRWSDKRRCCFTPTQR